MNLLRILTLLFFLSFFKSTKAQTVTPKFKQLILVAYRPVSTGNRESIRMEDYLEINENGMLYYVVNSFTGSYYNNLTFKGSRSDTTYKISDSLVNVLNGIFNGSKPLKAYTLKSNPAGQFAGPYTFLSYKTIGSQKEDVIIISSDAAAELDKVLDKLWRLPFPRRQKSTVTYRNKNVETQILSAQKADLNLPEIVAPPSLGSLTAPASN